MKTFHFNITYSLISKFKFENKQFFNICLQETVHMKQPEGFTEKDNEQKIYQLKKGIYVLKQLSRPRKLDFIRSEFEP